MTEHAREHADTMEWGATAAERQGWLGKLTAVAPPDESARAAKRRLRVNYVALGFAVAGFIAVLVAQYLPWMHFEYPGAEAPSGSEGGLDLPLGALNTWLVVAVALTVPLVFSIIAVLVVAGDAIRVPLAAVALGLLAGLATTLVGLAQVIDEGTTYAGLSDSASARDLTSIGPGFTIGVAATVLLIVAAIVGARAPRARRDKDTAADDAEEQPLDLVVAPLPDSAYRGDIHSDPASTHG